MPAFYLTLVVVLLAGYGARDQMTIAALTTKQGQRWGVMVVAIVCAALGAAIAAFAGKFMLVLLPPPARPVFAAIALGMAGLESLILSSRRNLREPTHSLGALGIVLISHQLTDAARFLVFGLAVGMAAPFSAGLGGALGGAAILGLAWTRPGLCLAPAAMIVRRLFGLCLIVAALVLFLQIRGIL